jgi:hypothetical protein
MLDNHLYAEAIPFLDKAIGLLDVTDDFLVACYMGRGDAYRLSGNSAEARLDADRALSVDPFYPAALRQLAKVHFETENWICCYWAARYAAMLEPNDAPTNSTILAAKIMIDDPASGISWKDCSVCGKKASKTKTRKCGGCEKVYYCCKEEQVKHWQIHKLWCALNRQATQEEATSPPTVDTTSSN